MTASRRVLVVDDAELARKTLLAILDRAGYEARATGSIADAEHEIETWHPDCVLLDRRLPDGDGVEIAGSWRGQSWRASLRVVLMSGDPFSEDALAVADGVLLKPVGARAVINAVEAALAN